MYTRLSELGSGANGDVLLVECNAQRAALKLKWIGFREDDIWNSGVIELAILKYLANVPSRHLLLPEAFTLDTEYLGILMPAMSMDLCEFIRTKQFDIRYVHQLIDGLVCMHTNDVIHRDIKPQNILYDSTTDSMMIADFGMSVGLKCATPWGLTNPVVTLYYRPPDVLLGKSKYSYEIDIWSLGCVMYEMESGSVLFPGGNEIDQIHEIFRLLGVPNEQSWPGVTDYLEWKNFPIWLRQQDPFSSAPQTAHLIDQCLRYIPSERVSARDLLAATTTAATTTAGANVANVCAPAPALKSNLDILRECQCVYNRSNYNFDSQTLEWLYHSAQPLKLRPKSYELGIYLFSFMDQSVSPDEYHTYAYAALQLVCQFIEFLSPDWIDLINLPDTHFTKEDLLAAQIHLLKRCQFDLIRATPQDFIEEYCRVYPQTNQFRACVQECGRVCLLSHNAPHNATAEELALWAIYNACHRTQVPYQHSSVRTFDNGDLDC